MVFTRYDMLTTYHMRNEIDYVPFDKLSGILSAKPSNVVYCIFKKKLYGIISMGDIHRAAIAGLQSARINQNFVFITEKSYSCARNVFKWNNSVNEIPVINGKGNMLGEYSKWDDMIILKYFTYFRKNYYTNLYWTMWEDIVLVRPCSVFKQKHEFFEWWKNYISQYGVQTIVIDYSDIPNYYGKAKRILFVDEEEMRGIGTLIQDIMGISFDWASVYTYKKIINEIVNEIEKVIIGEGLKLIQKSDVNIFSIQCVDDGSEYFRNLKKNIRDKFTAIGKKPEDKIYEDFYREFFCELFTKEYADEVANIEFTVEHRKGMSKLKDCKSRYYNVIDGERKTIGQPQSFSQCIYLYGTCIAVGQFVEDRYTIASVLQENLNKGDYSIKVSNLGCWSNRYTELKRVIDTPLRKGDIIIIYMHNNQFHGIPNLNLVSVLERNNVPADWLVEIPQHMNHKVSSLWADAIYESIEPFLRCFQNERGNLIDIDKDYILQTYIKRYFTDFEPSDYDKIGAIVMNCNPFTYGHRYLIEESLKRVDFLIIFVVEENASLFTFKERFAMICEGSSEFKNILVVPSGQFILSQTTFPEYFIKVADEDIEENIDYDITLFAEQIAPRLNIKYRFVGEEPEDIVTRKYNQAMKRILPSKGIALCEIPRKQLMGRYISASLVRQALEEGDIELADSMIPKTTMKIICLEKE